MVRTKCKLDQDAACDLPSHWRLNGSSSRYQLKAIIIAVFLSPFRLKRKIARRSIEVTYTHKPLHVTAIHRKWDIRLAVAGNQRQKSEKKDTKKKIGFNNHKIEINQLKKNRMFLPWGFLCGVPSTGPTQRGLINVNVTRTIHPFIVVVIK